MSAVTAVPLRPLAKGSVLKLWIAVGLLVLVAAGGIETSADAWLRIRAGATLVQLYTGFVYGGPLAPSRIARGLARRAHAEGFARVQDAVGADAATGSAPTGR